MYPECIMSSAPASTHMNTTVWLIRQQHKTHMTNTALWKPVAIDARSINLVALRPPNPVGSFYYFLSRRELTILSLTSFFPFSLSFSLTSPPRRQSFHGVWKIISEPRVARRTVPVDNKYRCCFSAGHQGLWCSLVRGLSAAGFGWKETRAKLCLSTEAEGVKRRGR